MLPLVKVGAALDQLDMRISMLASTYNRFGAHPVLRELGDRMARVFGETEFGLADVEIVVWKDTSEPTAPTMEGLRARFRQEIGDLPKVRFERKRQRLRINYASGLELGWLLRIRPRPTEETLKEVFHELIGVLKGLRSKCSNKPGLEFGAFVEALLARRAAIAHWGEAITPAPHQKGSAIDPTEHWSVRFKIDWSQYHPKAQQLLDDPFYWDPANDDSPHGANSGAHLLSDFRRWRLRHSERPPWDYFLDSYRKVGLLGRLNQFRETKPADYVERDGRIAEMHDRDVIALAFALLKIDGACDPKVGHEATMALARAQDAAVTTRLGWTVTAKRRELAARIEEKLRGCV